MKNKGFIIALAALMLCSCADKGASSEDIKEIMSEAVEINETDKDEYACLPDGVRLDDERLVTELKADENGDISYDRLGVSFKEPDGYNSYLYECNEEEYRDEVNLTCTAAVFVMNASFPHSHEYIRLGYFTNIVCMSTPYSVVLENMEYYINKYETKADYRAELEKEIKRLAPAFRSCEGLDAYNYVNISSKEKKEWLDFNFTDEDGNFIVNDLINVLPMYNIFRAPAPDSSAGDISDEFIELGSGYMGLKLSFETKRNGIDMDKEVYWLIDPDEEGDFSIMHRVEFSKDKGARGITEPERFLEGLILSKPGFINKDDPLDYFGNGLEEEEEE